MPASSLLLTRDLCGCHAGAVLAEHHAERSCNAMASPSCKEDAYSCLIPPPIWRSTSSSRHQAASIRLAGMQGHASVMARYLQMIPKALPRLSPALCCSSRLGVHTIQLLSSTQVSLCRFACAPQALQSDLRQPISMHPTTAYMAGLLQHFVDCSFAHHRRSCHKHHQYLLDAPPSA